MIFATVEQNGKEQLCCVDKIGHRAFLIEEFFGRDLSSLAIDSNHADTVPQTINELISAYDAVWTDDMALFFGSNPELGIDLDEANSWIPLVKLDEIWSPLEETRGRSLLE